MGERQAEGEEQMNLSRRIAASRHREAIEAFLAALLEEEARRGAGAAGEREAGDEKAPPP